MTAKPTLWKWEPIFFGLISCLIGAAAAAAPCPPDALGVERTLKLSAQGGWQVGLKSYPQTLALEDHEVVLTFDDGPGPGTTEKVLDALAAQCVKATFFLSVAMRRRCRI